MKAPPSEIYEFDEFRIDAVKRRLTARDGTILPLTPKAFETLLYLARHAGVLLEKEEIMRAVWADTIVEENNLNQSISAIRRALGEKQGDHRFIVTVPGRGYRFVAEVGNAADAAIPAAARSEPAESLSARRDVSENETPVRHAPEISNSAPSPLNSSQTRPPRPEGARMREALNLSRPKALLAAGIFAAVLLGAYLWSGNQEKVPDAPIKSVAVLPFKSLVAENRNETLEMGMADSLIAKLSSSEQIVVRPLETVRRAVSSGRDSLTVGRELQTEAVLDGSIQTAGERIRISARLLRTSDGKQLWAGQFDEKLTDIFALQDSISERVAAALQTRLGALRKKHPTENVEAYQLYMKGRFHASRSTREEIDKAVAYYRQAIEIDPAYALAYVGLSLAYRSLAVTSDIPSNETMPQAKAAGRRAVELDETLAEAHVALAAIAFWYDWDWPVAEAHYRRALELDPNNPGAHSAYAHFLSNTARHEKALSEARRGRELDPLRISGGALEGQYLLYAGKPDEAFDRLQKTLDLDPNFWLAYLVLSRVYEEKGRHLEAFGAAEKARQLSKVNSESVALMAYSLARAGDVQSARALLGELQKTSRDRYVPPYNFALVHHALGEKNTALDYLEKAFAEKDVRMVFLKIEPKWNGLRAEPRFVELMRRMNFD